MSKLQYRLEAVEKSVGGRRPKMLLIPEGTIYEIEPYKLIDPKHKPMSTHEGVQPDIENGVGLGHRLPEEQKFPLAVTMGEVQDQAAGILKITRHEHTVNAFRYLAQACFNTLTYDDALLEKTYRGLLPVITITKKKAALQLICNMGKELGDTFMTTWEAPLQSIARGGLGQFEEFRQLPLDPQIAVYNGEYASLGYKPYSYEAYKDLFTALPPDTQISLKLLKFRREDIFRAMQWMALDIVKELGK